MTGRRSWHSPSASHAHSQPNGRHANHLNNNNNNIYPPSKTNGSVSPYPNGSTVARKTKHSPPKASQSLPSSASPPPSNFTRLFCYVTIATVSFVLFTNTLGADLVHDDIFAIKKNRDVMGSSPMGQIFVNDFWGKPMSDNTSHKSYRPLCILTFRLNYLVSGFQPFSYHLVNIVLHSTVCVAFTYVCHTVVFRDIRPAFVSGLLFAIHPVHTEAVAGVVGRADVLSCLLFLLSFLAFTRCVSDSQSSSVGSHDAGGQRSGRLPLFLCVLLALCALLVKEHAATVLGVCMGYDIVVESWHLLQSYSSRSGFKCNSTHPSVKRFMTRSAILIGAVSLFLGFRIWMLDGQLPVFSEEDNPASFASDLTTRFLTYTYLVAFNIWLLLCPATLSYDWQVGSIPLVGSWWDVRNLATLASFLSLGILGLHCLLRSKGDERRILACGLLFLGVPFLPASNLFIRVGFVVAERILYIPSLGYCILVAFGLWKIFIHLKSHLLGRASLAVFVTVTMLCLSRRTWVRNRVWESRESLFRSGLETLPHNAKMHYNYGNYLMDAGQTEEAIHHFTETIRLYPGHASANNNLGSMLSQSQPDDAERYLLRALEINPMHTRAYFNLANIHSNQGDIPVAEKLFERALEIDPLYLDAINSLASLKQSHGDFGAAEDLYQRALTLEEAASADVHNNYAAFLMNRERRKEALHHYQACLKIDPAHVVAMTNMARLLRHLNRTTEAEQWYIRALSLKRTAKSLQSLAAFYYNTDRPSEAVILYKEALQIEPGSRDIQLQYAQVLTRLGHLKEAETFLRKSLKSQPDVIELHRLLASVYSVQNLFPQALEEVEHALALEDSLDDNMKAELLFEKANHLKGLNRLELAQQSYEDALALNPEMGSCLLNLGALHHLKGSYKQARIYYEKALAFDPDNKILMENIAKLTRAESKSRKTS